MSTASGDRERRIVGHGVEALQGEGEEKWVPGSRAEIERQPLPEAPDEEVVLVDADAVKVVEEEGEGEEVVESASGEEGVLAEKMVPEEEPISEEDLSSVQRLVLSRVEDAAGLLRTMLMEKGEGREAAVVMVVLGQRIAAEVMKRLNDAEIEAITQALNAMQNASAEEHRRVIDRFKQRLQDGDFNIGGGIDFARGVLERAVGPRKAQEVIDRVTARVSSGFYMLQNVAPDQIAPFISHEHPQTIALILSQLEAPQAAGILVQLPERMQSDVAYRIATMENITPSVIKQIEEGLESSLRDVLVGNQDVGGPKVVADIVNLTGSSVEKNVLDQMDGQDPEVAEEVRNLMFTFEDISKLTDREIQTLLREVDQKDLVIALKAATNNLKDKVLGNMSEKVRTFITEEMEFLGPMRLSEVEEVQLRIVHQVRQLEEQGQVTIVRGDADDQFV